MIRNCYGYALYFSESDKIGGSYESNSDCDENKGVGNKIREDHERYPANQWDDRLLLLAVHEESEPDRAEQ